MTELRPIELSADQRAVLQAVFNLHKTTGQFVSQKDLAKKLEKSPEDLKPITDKLFRDGFLSARAIQPQRSTIRSKTGLGLSPKGRTALGLEQAP